MLTLLLQGTSDEMGRRASRCIGLPPPSRETLPDAEYGVDGDGVDLDAVVLCD
jgi:hypothetical protein